MNFFVLESVWTDDVIKFKGEFYNIPASKIGPKSIQNPHPPIYLGGLSPNTFRRIVIYDAEGWVVTARGSIQQIEDGIEILRDEAIKADKDPNKFRVIVIVPPHIISHSDNSNDNENQSRDKDNDKITPTVNSIFRYRWTNWNPQCFFTAIKNFKHESFRKRMV